MGAALADPTAEYERMKSFQESDEGGEARRKRGHDSVACFLHLRDLVYRHPEAASASAVSVVRELEAKVAAVKAALDHAPTGCSPIAQGALAGVHDRRKAVYGYPGEELIDP
jgi:hypothetical protein